MYGYCAGNPLLSDRLGLRELKDSEAAAITDMANLLLEAMGGQDELASTTVVDPDSENDGIVSMERIVRFRIRRSDVEAALGNVRARFATRCKHSECKTHYWDPRRDHWRISIGDSGELADAFTKRRGLVFNLIIHELIHVYKVRATSLMP